jgi:hypothetical protein
MKIIFDNIIDPVNCTLKDNRVVIGRPPAISSRYFTFSDQRPSGILQVNYPDYEKLFPNIEHKFSLCNDKLKTHFKECRIINDCHAISEHEFWQADLEFIVEEIGKRSIPLENGSTTIEWVNPLRAGLHTHTQTLYGTNRFSFGSIREDNWQVR